MRYLTHVFGYCLCEQDGRVFIIDDILSSPTWVPQRLLKLIGELDVLCVTYEDRSYARRNITRWLMNNVSMIR